MRADNFLMVNKNWIFNLFFPMSTGEEMTSTKTTPKIWWLRDTFIIIQNGTNLLSLRALKQHSGLRWCSGTYPTWHRSRLDPIRKLNGKLEGSGRDGSTWHRINCETGKILRFPNNNGWDYVLYRGYTQKNGRLFVGNGDVIRESITWGSTWKPFKQSHSKGPNQQVASPNSAIPGDPKWKEANLLSGRKGWNDPPKNHQKAIWQMKG